MGSTTSANKDFNRVLATQPRRSIDIPKFDAQNNTQQQPLTNPLSIPEPMRFSQTNNRNENAPVHLFQPSETSIQRPIESTNLPLATPLKPDQEKSLPQIIERSASYSSQSNLPKLHQTNNGDAVVISRAVVNANDYQRPRNNRSSSVQPFRTTVERNGKQFLVEFNERTELRFVQYVDEITHQARFFEVIDHIPCRVIRPYKYKSQSTLQNDASQDSSLSNRRSNHRSARSRVSNGRSEIAAPLRSIGNTSVDNHRDPSINNTPNDSSTVPRLTTQNPTDSNHSSSQSIRTHSSVRSDESMSYSTAKSFDSGEEIYTGDDDIIDRIFGSNEVQSSSKRTNQSISNTRNSAAADGHNSPTSLDPFARSKKPSNHHHYRHRTDANKYAEPVIINRRFQQSGHSDYAPIPNTMRQSN